MPYAPRNFDRLYGTAGFSDALLRNHFALYENYVKNTNLLLQELSALAQASRESSTHYAELKRRQGWEFNGMRLHELYFGNMKKGGSPLPAESELARKMADDFGSREAWEKDFRGVGAMRGIGWAALYYDPAAERLLNFWIDEHDAGHPSGLAPVLLLDVFEHAFITDYGLKKADYIAAFFAAVDWEEAENRFRQAREHAASLR
jgi:superoxide dismutase, Fe-Mn family